jgi:hypothetical protein
VIKPTLLSTEFWLAVVGYGTALHLIQVGEVHNGTLLMIGAAVAYGLSRGLMKHGYGKALNRPNNTRL